MRSESKGWRIEDPKTGEVLQSKRFDPPVSLQESYDSLPTYINGTCIVDCVFSPDRPTEGTGGDLGRAERVYDTITRR